MKMRVHKWSEHILRLATATAALGLSLGGGGDQFSAVALVNYYMAKCSRRAIII